MRHPRLVVPLLVLSLILVVLAAWPRLINSMLPPDSRPGKIDFVVERVTAEEFGALAEQLTQQYSTPFNHIERFKKARILSYEGPKTCLKCHWVITVKDAVTGQEKKVSLMKNLLTSAHYRFFTKRHPNVYGFNGVLADNFPMGKIDRPCPKPGSFAMTAWVELVNTKDGRTYSEGCGQCHIGGQYQAPLGEIMPGYRTLRAEKDAIDCLVCHAVAYDMNKKQVVTDKNGRLRWGQDRSMRAAMSVTTPTAQNCLRCHQHNFGGDVYVDSLGAPYMQSSLNLGAERPRIRHPGSKRGTPYSPSWDVHAAGGISCVDCHATEGHLIAKGTHTTTMMANDLPNVEVTCEKCHSDEPHRGGVDVDANTAEFLNAHTEKVACQTCHIPSLNSDNVTMRDFSTPLFEKEPGIYIYDDVVKETGPGRGIVYAWWNGDGSFLGNPIGDNPNGRNLYRFYKPTNVWPEYKKFDYRAWYERVMRPIAQKGRKSKLYAMKLYNGKQHIDLQNITPFGGMFVPYNFPTYYATGDANLAAQKEMQKSTMKMMYGWMFDFYLMNKFMTFMGAKGWNASSYKDVLSMRKVEPRWLPNNASMEIDHAIRREGALSCSNCHNPNGVLDWKDLGYTEDEIQALTINPLEQ
ncbi:MAG: hypothetical protein NTX17_07980 [Candidatus Eisenbacteria bacterium]|nr:hypothetical protein [Candidatus Eisenbacteria bacterium]